MNIKYEDKYLTMKHYKEPLLEIPKSKGYGYYGAILITLDGTQIQCHICGKLFANLSMHVFQSHDMRAREYKDAYQLSPKTALVSETERERMKQRTLEYIKTLTPSEKAEYRRHAIEGRKKRGMSQPKMTLETKNKRGTCPDQLLAKIKEVAGKVGHTPTLAEFIDVTGGQRFKHLIFTTFGSWKNALKLANLQPADVKKGGFRKYTNEELLEYLSIFAQENRTLPTATDCKRGLLPDYAVFQRRFGTFEEARKLAGVYNFI